MTIPFSITFNCLIALFGFHSCLYKFYFPVTPVSPSSQKQHFRNLVQAGPVQLTKIHHVNVLHASLKACLLGGGGPQIGELICGGSPHLSCKHVNVIKLR